MPTLPNISARALWLLLAALAVALAAVPSAGARKPPSIRTPGYKGTTKAPKTVSVTPAPKPVKVGVGDPPSVLVDAAGTSHVVWKDRFGDRPTLHYCRIKRGTSGCDVTKDFAQTTPSASQPLAVAYGDTLVLLTQRGTSSAQGAVIAYVSDDGGEIFNEAVVGGPVADPGGGGPDTSQLNLWSATTFGAPGSERIALAYSGGYVQVVRPGSPPTPMFDLTPENDEDRVLGPYAGVAPSGTGLVAAFQVGNRTGVRTWNGTGEVTDPGQWTPRVTIAGERPLLSGGPGGTFLQTQDFTVSSKTPLQLRKLGATGTPSAPITLSTTPAANTAAPVQDAAGNVITAWSHGTRGADPRDEVASRIVAGGSRTAGAEKALYSVKSPAGIVGPAVAVAPDGGGFVGMRQFARAGGESSVIVNGFGTLKATGKLGLGSEPGGGPSTVPGVTETCSRIEFAAVDVVGQGGCLLGAVNNKQVKVSETTIRLNGLEIVPGKDVKILLNSRARTIDTTGSVTVQVRSDDITIPLFRGELHLQLPSESDNDATVAPGCSGQKLFAFDSGVSEPSIKGFPIQGQIAAFLKPDSVCIPVSLSLPKALGGIRGNTVLEADNKRGLHVESVEIFAPTIPVGPVLIQDLQVRYTAGPSGQDTWSGGARVTFPPGFVLGASVTFQGGDFKSASVTVSPTPWPGTPLFSGVYLSRVTGSFGVDPLKLGIGARIGALPTNPPDGYAVTVDGSVTATFGDPFTLEASGVGALFGIQVARIDLLINSDFYFQASANVDIDLTIAAFSGGLKAFIDGPRKQFGGEINARVKVFGYDAAAGEAVISSRGIGGCAKILDGTIEIGAGYKWGDPVPFGVDTTWGSCNLTPYRLTAPGPGTRSAGAFAAQASGFPVAAGKTLASVKLVGAGGPPSVVLVAPGGERITPVVADDPAAKGAKAIAGISPKENATYIAIPKPAAGNWGIEVQPGSPGVAQVMQALPLPEPKVTAKVGGKGRARTLTVTSTPVQFRTFTFFEVTPRGERLIGVTDGTGGKLKFTSAPGDGGKRVIEAAVAQDGIPRERVQVASYIAPAIPRPGAVKGVKVARSKGGVLVTWRGGTGATSFLVAVNAADGRRNVLVAKRRTLRVAAIPKGDRVTVTVRARNSAGKLGRAATGRG
jgi:hypothetical protein